MSRPQALLDHVHGVAQQRCIHPDCQRAWYRYQKRYRLDRDRGHTRTIGAERVRLHILTLHGAYEMSYRAIAAAADVAVQSVCRIAKGEQPTITRRIAAKILAVVPHVPRAASKGTKKPFVSRVGTVRRLQALMFMGWPHAVLKAEYGINSAALLNQQGRWVERDTHDKVATVYRELCTRFGGSTRSRSRAIRYGYLPPTAWDDIDLDPGPDGEFA